VIPWEVSSSELDPVTTDRPSGREIGINASHGKSMSPIIRRPLSDQGEEIVCASGNGGGTRSSDLHEWRNDLGAVSTRDPVKL
jgi:hypothetical protein